MAWRFWARWIAPARGETPSGYSGVSPVGYGCELRRRLAAWSAGGGDSATGIRTENGNMFRTMLTVACVVLVVGWALPAMAGDCLGCKKVEKAGQGFCAACDQGKIFGVELTSQKLYDAVAGKKIDAEKLKCGG